MSPQVQSFVVPCSPAAIAAATDYCHAMDWDWEPIYELADWLSRHVTWRELLEAYGFVVDDDPVDVGAEVLRVARAIAHRGLYLCQTDHLSDRELWRFLRDRLLGQPPSREYFLFPGPSLLPLAACDDYFRYYADEDERREFAAAYPDYAPPDRQVRRYDRDRHLPHCPEVGLGADGRG